MATDADQAKRFLLEARSIAVLGASNRPSRPAHYVPAYLRRVGYEVVPVPVYYPEVTEILGEPVYRSVSEIPGDIDLVVVFRRPADVLPHVDDIIAKKPGAVWMQLGISNPEAAEKLIWAGIDVVQDRCTMVEHRSI